MICLQNSKETSVVEEEGMWAEGGGARTKETPSAFDLSSTWKRNTLEGWEAHIKFCKFYLSSAFQAFLITFPTLP